MPKATSLHDLYKDSLSVLQGWRIADISPSIRMMKPNRILGKPKTGRLVLTDTELVMHKLID